MRIVTGDFFVSAQRCWYVIRHINSYKHLADSLFMYIFAVIILINITKMKKTLLLLAAFAMTMAASAGNIHIKGTVENGGDSVAAMAFSSKDKAVKSGINNNKFDFNFPLESVDLMMVRTKPAAGQQRGAVFMFLAVPGETAELSTAGTHYYVSGSKFYQAFNQLDRATENMKSTDEQVACLINYIKKNPNTDAPVAFFSQLGDYDAIMKIYKQMSVKAKNGRMKQYIARTLANAKAEKAEAEAAAKKQAAGLVAPDFTLNDINGKPLKLSSLQGKYVLLDFWGSWCIWCMRGMPQMKSYYEKYKGKFEILGIDCNESEAKWKEAVAKNNLSWLHVYNPRTSSVLADYGIQGFPTKILIGPDGKIVKTIVGEDPTFYTFLDGLFGK